MSSIINEEMLKTCCLYAVIAAAGAVALAQFVPNLYVRLPAGTLRKLYKHPLYFGLVVGLIVFVLGGLIHAGTKSSNQFNYYAHLLHPETYGYSGLSPAGGSRSKRVQFKNFMK